MTAQIRPAGPSLSKSTVVVNYRSVFASALLFLNVAIMPLKAYVSEPFPWHDRSELWDYEHNCSVSFELCHAGWDSFFHKHKPAYGVAFGQSYDVLQENLTISPVWTNFSSDAEPDVVFAVFETPPERRSMLQILNNQAPVTSFSHFNVARLFGIPVSYSASWGELANGTACIWIGFRTAEFSTPWQSFKFAVRSCLTLYIVWRMWTSYYKHYVVLVTNLARFGLPHAGGMSTVYEVVLGDPTSIILLDPLVSVVFVVDFWLSADYVTRAFMRLTQTEHRGIFLTACFYLSRTVWFAYAGLAAFSKLLKRWRKEHCFAEVDPSLVAMGVAVIAGPFTCLQFRVPFLLVIYRFLFTCVLTPAQTDEGGEVSLGAFVYSMLMGLLPLSYGLAVPLLAPLTPRTHVVSLVRQKTCALVNRAVAAQEYNDWKHRLLLWAIGRSMPKNRKDTYALYGGSVYQLLATSRCFKANVCMSQRGADCYVIFATGAKTVSVRLSLLQCLDRRCVRVQQTTTEAVGRIDMFSADVDVGSVTIHVGANRCQWLM
ncbi:hypothetical protein ACHHYP_04896 [Achlya hypogyna]|uniref:Transmembrane protein n=1 Tax=Achlya hypogyna TaxID=1202772 RepID=A0A1V9YZV3_ACHHY|nr:hypothetical protein ACHHYP_04896 [Achlya hypogyna]